MKKTFSSSQIATSGFANTGLSEDQAQSTWLSLRKAIEEIQSGNASKLRFEELYRNSYTLALHKHGELLYNGVKDCVTSKLRETSKIVSTAANDRLVEVLVEQWENHKLIMSMIRDILMYMDKTYCKSNKKVVVYEMGVMLFRDTVVRHAGVNTRLKTILLEDVLRERQGEVIDRVLMKNCLAMLVEVNVRNTDVYQKDFETDFLEATRNFYKQESQDFFAQNTCPDYLRKIEQRLSQEENRADAYLDKSSKPKLRAVVQEELITKYAQRLVEDERTGCSQMFQNNQLDDLTRLYALFSREKPTLDFVRQSLTRMVRELGTTIVKDPENPKNPKAFVQHVLDMRAKYHRMVVDAFRDDREFAKCLKEALEYFINLDARSAQYLSLYIDDMLRKGIKGLPEQEREERLSHVILIFRYLQDKDVFEDFYKQHLASRLLKEQSVDDETERHMLLKLKAECGQQFTSRLEGMFKDMDLSKKLMKDFKQLQESSESESKKPSTDLNVTVLTTGFWPMTTMPDCNLPPEAKDSCAKFQAYYTNLHSGRRLTWQTSLGTAELRMNFESGRKELIVHTYQMAILMLFNHANEYTYQDIQKATNIPDAELQRHLLSLAHPKVRVLCKLPNNKTVEPTHSFKYNTAYTSKLYRVRIPLLTTGAAQAEKKEPVIPSSVMEARKNTVEAALVRVMKSRKTLDHNNLIAEVMKQLASKFVVEPAFIKKRIESLIEREYIERDKDNRRLYHYMA